MDELMHKHLNSEEQEIIDCILAGPLHESVKDFYKGRKRLQGLVKCKGKRDKIDHYKCKIKVYERYITSLSNELIRNLTDKRKQEVQSKILTARERIERWRKVIAVQTALQSKDLNINKDKTQKKLLKKKLKTAKKASKKKNLWGFRV